MDTLRDTLLSVSDHTMLERCGIVTSVQSFGSKRVICRDSPCVLHQNDLFQSFWRLAFSMVRSHATVLSRHTSGCPYVLAGILHPTKWHQSLDFLRRASEAYEAAKVSTVPEIVAMVKNCQLQGSVVRLAVLFGRAGDWRVITSQLRELCQGLFEGMGASKMAEDCIMKMRDHETRDAPSKSAARFRNWSVPVNSKLVEAYGRTEVVPTGNAQVPAEFSDNRLFEVTHTKSDAGDSVPLRWGPLEESLAHVQQQDGSGVLERAAPADGPAQAGELGIGAACLAELVMARRCSVSCPAVGRARRVRDFPNLFIII